MRTPCIITLLNLKSRTNLALIYRCSLGRSFAYFWANFSTRPYDKDGLKGHSLSSRNKATRWEKTTNANDLTAVFLRIFLKNTVIRYLTALGMHLGIVQGSTYKYDLQNEVGFIRIFPYKQNPYTGAGAYKDGPEIWVACPVLSFLFCFCVPRPISAVHNFLACPLLQTKCFLISAPPVDGN